MTNEKSSLSNNRPLIVAITGGIGSGKTTIADILRSEGYYVYDSDKEARFLQNYDAVIRQKTIQQFGEDAYTANGLNRPFLASIVFKDDAKLKILNEIVHPVVEAHFFRWITEHSDQKVLFHESAILFESGFSRLADKIILVTAPKDLRVKRVMRRDAVSAEHVKSRMSRQFPESEIISKADFVINTNSKKGILKAKINDVLQQILS